MREQNIYDALDSILLILWCMFVIGGCTYLVFWMDVSGWWYALAILLIETSNTSYNKELNAHIKNNK